MTKADDVGLSLSSVLNHVPGEEQYPLLLWVISTPL